MEAEGLTYSVYKHTFPNGKMYVGMTKTRANYRWSNGNGYHGNKELQDAISEFGWGNIKHEIIAENLSEEDACALERNLIVSLDLRNPEKGYNKAVGGRSRSFFETDEERQENLNRIKYEWCDRHPEQRKEIEKKYRESEAGKESLKRRQAKYRAKPGIRERRNAQKREWYRKKKEQKSHEDTESESGRHSDGEDSVR